MTIEARQRVTAEDVLEISARTGTRYEVVEGEPREMAPTGGVHGGSEALVSFVLVRHLVDHPIGRVATGEVLCRLKRNPDTARAADVALIRNERLPNGRLPVGPFEGAPDLVVEIVSPGDTFESVLQKVFDWLEAGAAIIWLLLPATRGVMIWRPDGASPELRGDAEVDAEPILPGFRCRVRELFPD
jgi:Uma2 family endonuclease